MQSMEYECIVVVVVASLWCLVRLICGSSNLLHFIFRARSLSLSVAVARHRLCPVSFSRALVSHLVIWCSFLTSLLLAVVDMQVSLCPPVSLFVHFTRVPLTQLPSVIYFDHVNVAAVLYLHKRYGRAGKKHRTPTMQFHADIIIKSERYLLPIS